MEKRDFKQSRTDHLAESALTPAERTRSKTDHQEIREDLLMFAAQVPGMLYQYEIAPDGRISVPFSTAGIKDIFGCTPQEVMDDYTLIAKVIHPDDQKRLNAAISRSMQTLAPYQIEYRVQLPGQPLRWILGRAKPERKEDGTIVFYGFNTDISEHKETEALLRDRQERLSLIFSTSQDAIIITVTDGRILEANPAAERLFGRSQEELKGLTRYDLVDMRDPRLRTAQEERRRTGAYRGELNFLRRDGTVFPAELHTTVYTDSHGNEKISLFIRDISPRKQAQELLAKERELFETTLMSVSEGIVLARASGEILIFNQGAQRITGYSKDEALGRTLQEVFKLIHIKTGKSAHADVIETLRSGKNIDMSTDYAITAKNGEQIRVSASISMMKAASGDDDRIIASFRDISKEYELQKQIEGFLDVNLDILCVGDLDGYFVKVNKKFEEVLGYRTEEIVGTHFNAYLHPDDMKLTEDAITDLDRREPLSGFVNRYRCRDGSYKYIEWNSVPGVGRYIYSSARDITQQRLHEEQLRQAAIRDELTGLHNRHYFESILPQQIEHAERYDEPLSMLLLDLDHFKDVNDAWGHPIGDELLKLTAEVLSRSIREADIPVRMGGEEFVVLLPRTSLEGALCAAENIRAAVESHPLAMVGPRTVSIGAAQRLEGESFRHWYKRVDDALYRAKQSGRNRVSASDGQESEQSAALNLEWRKDLESGHPEIDRQHQELFSISNQLINLTIDGRHPDEIALALDNLIEHTSDHFAYEERAIKEAGYPEAKRHADIHLELLAKARRLKEAYRKEKLKATAFFTFFTDDVVLDHMMHEDRKFFRYLRGHHSR